MLIAFSHVVLLVISVDRYLAKTFNSFCLLSYYCDNCEREMSINVFIVPHEVSVLIFDIIFIPPMFFIRCKLFTLARKSRRNNAISAEIKIFFLKNVSSCLLVVVCLKLCCQFQLWFILH